MRHYYTLSLLSLSLFLSIIIIIIIISIINAISRKKNKQRVGRMIKLLINKTVFTCSYGLYLCRTFFFLFVCFFVVKSFYILEFNNCVCKFDKTKNNNLLEKDIDIDTSMYKLLECSHKYSILSESLENYQGDEIDDVGVNGYASKITAKTQIFCKNLEIQVKQTSQDNQQFHF